MKNHGSRIDFQFLIRNDTCIMPSKACTVIHNKHMVCKIPSKCKFIRIWLVFSCLTQLHLNCLICHSLSLLYQWFNDFIHHKIIYEPVSYRNKLEGGDHPGLLAS